MSATSSTVSGDARVNASRGTAQPAREAFDRIAPAYDQDFTNSLIGRLQREAVWRHIDSLFPSGARILDVGCGTGADAIHLASRGVHVHAVDVSRQMIAAAATKAAASGLSDHVTTEVLAIEDLPAWNRQSCLLEAPPRITLQDDSGNNLSRHQSPAAPQQDRQDCLSHYDGAISNFGALNCVPELRPVAKVFASLVRPGGHVAINLISTFCLWETVSFAFQGKFAKSLRRWTNHRQATASLNGSAGFPVYYHPVSEVKAAFEPEFRLKRRRGIGILVPPTYLESLAKRVEQLTTLCARVDRSIAACPLIRAAADHTLLMFTRR